MTDPDSITDLQYSMVEPVVALEMDKVNMQPPTADLENVIYRGNWLRDTKQLAKDPCYRYSNSLKVRSERSPLKKPTYLSRASSPRTKSPSMSRQLSPSKRDDRSRAKLKRCPLRVAELAEPSKRQCLDTWRNNAHKLPDFMVERLKHHVLDQKTVAHIPDAINCFKIKPAKYKNATLKKYNQTEEYLSITKQLCAMLGLCIAKELIRPRSLVLTPALARVADVVYGEITSLMKQHCTCTVTEQVYNHPIQEEMSAKIALWIGGIMQDLDEKILEEDLKELEEEEGPVLDFLEDLFEDVMGICRPNYEDAMPFISSKVTDSIAEGSTYASIDESVAKGASLINEVNGEINIQRHMKDVIKEIVDEIVPESENNADEDAVNDEESNNDDNRYPIFDDPEDIPGTPSETIPQDVDETNDTQTDEILEQSSTNAGDEVKHTLFSGVDIIEDKDHDVVDVKNHEAPVVNEEPPTIDETMRKSIHFSKTVIENNIPREIAGNTSPSSLSNYHLSPYMRHMTYSSDNMKRYDIHRPSERLLSQADEPWVPDLYLPLLKITSSICKSVSSLGFIEEKTERPQDRDSFITPENNIVTIIELDRSKTDIQETNLAATIPVKEELKEGTSSAKISDILDAKHMKPEIGKGDHVHVEAVTLREKVVKVHEESVKPKINVSATQVKSPKPNSKTKFDYRVNLKTAPAWALKRLNEEPKNGKLRSYDNKKLKQCDIRNLCRDLDHAFANVERCNFWLENVCKKVKYRRKEDNRMGVSIRSKPDVLLREWVTISKCINKDAALWRKLNHHHQEKLRPLLKFKMQRSNNKFESITSFGTSTSSSNSFVHVMPVLDEIDRLSAWTHRLVVSAEYCMKCKCRLSSSKLSTVNISDQKK